MQTVQQGREPRGAPSDFSAAIVKMKHKTHGRTFLAEGTACAKAESGRSSARQRTKWGLLGLAGRGEGVSVTLGALRSF